MLHVDDAYGGMTIRASMSGERAVILLLAVATFIVAVVSGVVSAVRHRA